MQSGRSFRIKSSRLLSCLAGTASSLTFCNVAMSADAAAADDASTLQEVVVTGSRIRGVAPVGSSLVQLGRAEIDSSTGTTVVDILKQVPQLSSNLGMDAAATALPGGGPSNASRNSAFNIRGLGTTATLSLIDGRRLPRSGITGGFIDPNNIPSIAVERVEVVADGASAIYGSDAIAGVINIITRQDFDGAEVSLRGGVADDYDAYQAAGILGTQWDTGGIVVATEYAYNSHLSGADRDDFRLDQRPYGGSSYLITTCAPGNLLIGGVPYAIPGSGSITPNSFTANTRQTCDSNEGLDILPEMKRTSASLNVNQRIGENINLYLKGFYLHRETNIDFWNAGSVTTLFTSTLPATNAYFVRPAGTSGTVTLESRMDPSRFPSGVDQHGEQDVYQYSIGGTWDLPGAWKAELTASFSRSDDEYYGRTIDTRALNAALASSNPATAFNPFGPTPASVIETIMQGQFNPFTTTKLEQQQLHFDGPLFDLPAGSVRAAVGIEHFRDRLSGGALRGSLSAPVWQAPVSNVQEVTSGFAELFVPVTSASSAIGSLDLSLAGRHDHYDDVGDTTNPKFGFNWRPADSLLIHGSYGKSFRAQAGGATPLSIIGAGVYVVTTPDPLAVAPSTTSIGLNVRGGNPDLEPETARTWSAGLEFTPEAIDGLTLGATYWSVKWEGRITSYSPSATVLPLVQSDLYGSLVTRYNVPGAPAFTQADLDALTMNGLLPISGVLPSFANIKWVYDSRLANIGSTEAQGIDLTGRYDFGMTDVGAFDVGMAVAVTTKFLQQQTPTAPRIDKLADIGNPVKYAGRAYLNWNFGGWSSQLSFNYVDGYVNDTVTPTEKVDSWLTADLHLAYTFEQPGFARDLTISLDANRLFNSEPPRVDVAGGYDPTQATALGRYVMLGVRKKW